jgi:hypothetical protein
MVASDQVNRPIVFAVGASTIPASKQIQLAAKRASRGAPPEQIAAILGWAISTVAAVDSSVSPASTPIVNRAFVSGSSMIGSSMVGGGLTVTGSWVLKDFEPAFRA